MQLGPLVVMSFLGAWNQSVLLRADFEQLRNATGGRNVEEREAVRGDDKRDSGSNWDPKSKKYHMSGIRKRLHNTSTLDFFCPAPALSLGFCQTRV